MQSYNTKHLIYKRLYPTNIKINNEIDNTQYIIKTYRTHKFIDGAVRLCNFAGHERENSAEGRANMTSRMFLMTSAAVIGLAAASPAFAQDEQERDTTVDTL